MVKSCGCGYYSELNYYCSLVFGTPLVVNFGYGSSGLGFPVIEKEDWVLGLLHGDIYTGRLII